MQTPVELVKLISDAASIEAKKPVPVRLFGSSAVRELCNRGLVLLDNSGRTIGDIDIVTYDAYFDDIRRGCAQLGLIESPDQDRLLMATGRLAFATADRCLVEVSGDPLRFYHDIWLKKRLTTLPYTIPPAELLMSKLQFEPEFLRETAKGKASIVDAAALLMDFGPGENDSSINVRVLKKVAQDFALATTLVENLTTVFDFLATKTLDDIPEDLRSRALANCQQLREIIIMEPKSARWWLSSVAHRVLPRSLGHDVE